MKTLSPRAALRSRPLPCLASPDTTQVQMTIRLPLYLREAAGQVCRRSGYELSEVVRMYLAEIVAADYGLTVADVYPPRTPE